VIENAGVNHCQLSTPIEMNDRASNYLPIIISVTTPGDSSYFSYHLLATPLIIFAKITQRINFFNQQVRIRMRVYVWVRISCTGLKTLAEILLNHGRSQVSTPHSTK